MWFNPCVSIRINELFTIVTAAKLDKRLYSEIPLLLNMSNSRCLLYGLEIENQNAR